MGDLARHELGGQFLKEGPKVHPLQVGPLVEGPVDQRERGDPLAGVGHGRPRGGVGERPLLHVEQRGDDLQVVLHAVVDLAHQRVLLGERIPERGVAPDDGVGHVLQGLGQLADLGRHLLGLHGPHAEPAARIERGDPLQISDPAHHDTVGHRAHRDQGQDEGQKRKEDTRQRIEPGPGQDPRRLRREHHIDLVAGHRGGGIDAPSAARVGPVPDVGPVQTDLVAPALRQDGEGPGVGGADVAAGAVGQRHVGVGRQGRVGDRGLEAGERDRRGEGAVELAPRPFGGHGSEDRGLGRIGLVGVAGDHQAVAARQPLEPGPERALRIGGHVAGRAVHPPAAVETYEVGVARRAPHHLGQAVAALIAHRPGRERLQEDARAFHARARGRRAAFGGEGQVLAKGDPLAVEGDRRLGHAEDQNGQQGGGQRRYQADPDRAQRTPSQTSHGGRPIMEGLIPSSTDGA